MSETKLGQDSRSLVERTNHTVELCSEDVNHSKTGLGSFIKANKDRFTEQDITLLLDILESLDLVEDRLRETNEDLSDLLFSSDE